MTYVAAEFDGIWRKGIEETGAKNTGMAHQFGGHSLGHIHRWLLAVVSAGTIFISGLSGRIAHEEVVLCLYREDLFRVHGRRRHLERV